MSEDGFTIFSQIEVCDEKMNTIATSLLSLMALGSNRMKGAKGGGGWIWTWKTQWVWIMDKYFFVCFLILLRYLYWGGVLIEFYLDMVVFFFDWLFNS